MVYSSDGRGNYPHLFHKQPASLRLPYINKKLLVLDVQIY